MTQRGIARVLVRFLIDECLSPHLVRVANQAGFEAHHVAHRGWCGVKDPALFRMVLEENFVLVTNNRDDFRDLVGRVELHPGLVVILANAPRKQEMEFFAAALARIQRDDRDMVNSVVEVAGDGTVARYELPPLA